MNQSNKKIGDLLKSVEVDFDIDGEWAKIEGQLPEQESRRRGWIYFLTGGLVILIILLGYTLLPGSDGSDTAYSLQEQTTQQSMVPTAATAAVQDDAINAASPVAADAQKGRTLSTTTSQENYSASTKESTPPAGQANRNLGAVLIEDDAKVSTTPENMDGEPVSSSSTDSDVVAITPSTSLALRSNDVAMLEASNRPLPTEIPVLVNVRPSLDFAAIAGLWPAAMVQAPPLVKSPNLRPYVESSNPVHNSSLSLTQSVLRWDATYQVPNAESKAIRTGLTSSATTLVWHRDLSDRWYASVGAHYRLYRDRFNYEGTSEPIVENITSSTGSVFVAQDGTTYYYDGTITRTTTETRMVQQYNRHHTVGAYIGLGYRLPRGFFAEVSASRDVLVAQQGLQLDENGNIAALKNHTADGGSVIGVALGWRQALSPNLSIDLAMSAQHISGLAISDRVVSRGNMYGIRLGTSYAF